MNKKNECKITISTDREKNKGEKKLGNENRK